MFVSSLMILEVEALDPSPFYLFPKKYFYLDLFLNVHKSSYYSNDVFPRATFNCDESENENQKGPFSPTTNHRANVPRPGNRDPIRAHDQSVAELQHYGDR